MRWRGGNSARFGISGSCMARAMSRIAAFDRRLKLEFHGAKLTSNGGPAYRELDDALGLTATAASTLAAPRRGAEGRSH